MITNSARGMPPWCTANSAAHALRLLPLLKWTSEMANKKRDIVLRIRMLSERGFSSLDHRTISTDATVNSPNPIVIIAKPIW